MSGKPTYEELEQKIEALENEGFNQAQDDRALRESEAKYRAIVEDQTEMICRFKPDCTLTVVNQSYARFWGKTPDEMIGVNFLGLIPEHAQEKVRKHFRSFSTANALQMQEHEVFSKTGEIRWQQWSNRAFFDDDGNVVEFQSVGQDITDRKRVEESLKESEEKYRLLVKSLPGIVYKGYRDWSVEFYDNRIERLTGYHMDEFNSHRLKWADLVVKEDLDSAKQSFIKALKTDKSYVRYYRLKTKPDNIIWVQERGYIVCNQDGGVDYVSGVFFDITDIKTAEGELKTSKALLHSTIESLPFDFFVMDKDGVYVLQNSSGRERWGSIVGKRPEDLSVRKETLASWLEANHRAFSGETVKDEMQYIHRGKEEIHHSIITPIISDGEILGILGANLDITDRKLVEGKIRKSEKKYRELWKGLRNGAAAVDMEGRIIEFNPAFQRMLGYDAEEIYNLTYEDITPQKWHPIEAKILEKQVLTRGYSDIYEKEYIKKDGTVFPVELITYLIQDEAGHPEGMWATISDITERKEAEREIRESEERYRNLYRDSSQREQLYESLLNATPDAVVIYNLTGEPVYINPAFIRIFGFTMEDVKNRRIPFVPESEEDKTKEGIEKVLGGESLSGFETRRLTRDGRILDISLSSSCYSDYQGNVAGVVVFLRDVTEAKHTEKQLLHYQKMEAVGTLAGGIAHDFNNLLQAVQGYTEILLFDRDMGEPGHRELQQISHAAKRGSELTRQLLTFSRKVESTKLLINLNREVKQARELLERTIPKMINIELDLEKHLKTIDADPTQVEQVIMNLAINAKDAMPEGGRLIIKTEHVTLDEKFCRAHLGSSPGDYVLLTVSDSGYGMAKEVLEHIFEPFFTTKELGQGTGLGLSIVYGIVKSHHGYITCHSKLGEGTAFKAYFPALDQPAKPEDKETRGLIKGGTETILLVDDENYIRDLGKQMLEKFGYKVFTAPDGESALDLYRKERDRIHLVILDLIMPGMGGIHCLAEILKLNTQAKVIIISGYSETVPIKETIEIGAKDFAAKPFEVEKMLEMVRTVLDE